METSLIILVASCGVIAGLIIAAVVMALFNTKTIAVPISAPEFTSIPTVAPSAPPRAPSAIAADFEKAQANWSAAQIAVTNAKSVLSAAIDTEKTAFNLAKAFSDELNVARIALMTNATSIVGKTEAAIHTVELDIEKVL